jgi:hypothetical protein
LRPFPYRSILGKEGASTVSLDIKGTSENRSTAFGFTLGGIARKVNRKIRVLISREKDEPGDPDEPFAMVGAPLKPRRPLNSSSVAVQPEQ